MIVTESENIIDLITSTYGGLDSMFFFLGLNSGVTSVTQTLPYGYVYSAGTFTTTPVAYTGYTSGVFVSTGSTTIMFGQSVFDLALQFYGDISQAINIANSTEGIENVSATNINGINFNFTLQQVPNNNVAFYNKNNIVLATNLVSTSGSGVTPIPPVSGRSFDISFNFSFN